MSKFVNVCKNMSMSCQSFILNVGMLVHMLKGRKDFDKLRLEQIKSIKKSRTILIFSHLIWGECECVFVCIQ